MAAIDPINAALRTSLTKRKDSNMSLESYIAGSTKKALLGNIEFEPAGSYHNSMLNELKSKYVVLKSSETLQTRKTNEGSEPESHFQEVKCELFPLTDIQLGWRNCNWSVGAGMINLGSTCYMNSILQAFFHTPALVNWLLADKEHAVKCRETGEYCVICALRKTLQDSQKNCEQAITPSQIYNKLELIMPDVHSSSGHNGAQIRQHDPYEFMRCLVKEMKKSFLHRLKNHKDLDSKTKETTPVNQIFCGYLQSSVRCTKCGHTCIITQPFQDLSLDIRNVHSLEEALELFFSKKNLSENRCESCYKTVQHATEYLLERPPMVLCIQLKRFDTNNHNYNKISKHIWFRTRLDLTRYARKCTNVPLIYKLVALVNHVGSNINEGHYTAVAQTPSGSFYQFDDSVVRSMPLQTVFNTNAYILMYELASSPFAQKPITSLNNTVIIPKKTETELTGTCQNKSKTENVQNRQADGNGESEEIFKEAKCELFPLKAVQLGWRNGNWSVGAGMVNLGYTCYLNAILQALFHIPALVNWLLADKDHVVKCKESGEPCIICALRKTLQDSQQNVNHAIAPSQIYNKLELIMPGIFWLVGRDGSKTRRNDHWGQQDAHEFMRYLVEAMEKSFLRRYKNHKEFDPKTKETTPLNQIFGGYLRSAVRCLKCGHVSTTFQHFQDLLLDIKNVDTLEEAVELFFSTENIEYHCDTCLKKVQATTQFSLERAPMVLCIQLKRFYMHKQTCKISKHICFRKKIDLTRFSRNRTNVSLVYRLVALVNHIGLSAREGHYTAVAQTPSGNFYHFDDSSVRPMPLETVFNTNAYIMIYELESSPFVQKPTINTKLQNQTEAALSNGNKSTKVVQNGGNFNDQLYGPQLPPEKLKKSLLNTTNGINGKASFPVINTETEDNKKTSAPKDADSGNNKIFKSTNGTMKKSIVDNQTLQSRMKLVPYESEDTSSSEDLTVTPATVETRTKSTVNDWQVTSSTDVNPENNKKENWANSNKPNNSVLNELLKMSHNGYSGPVSSWNGNRSQLDKEVQNERRVERKRALVDNSDQGRVKHPKTSSNFKANPGYNPVQEFHNAKNWGNNSDNYKLFFKGNRHRQNFHSKNYHKNYRYHQ